MAPGLFPIDQTDEQRDKIIENIKIKNKECETFIKQLFRNHKCNLARHEIESCRIKCNPFSIEFKEGVNIDPVHCKECPIRKEYFDEIQRQIDHRRGKRFTMEISHLLCTEENR